MQLSRFNQPVNRRRVHPRESCCLIDGQHLRGAATIRAAPDNGSRQEQLLSVCLDFDSSFDSQIRLASKLRITFLQNP